MSPQVTSAPCARSAEILSKAVVRAADLLGITQACLAEILGVSEVTVSRLRTGAYKVPPTRKREWQFAQLFVRLFRSLDAILGHGEEAQAWLRGRNLALGAPPIELLRSAEGLICVLHYLDEEASRFAIHRTAVASQF